MMWAISNGEVEPQIRPSLMCYHAEFDRSTWKNVGVKEGTSNSGSAEAPLPSNGGVVDSWNKPPPHTCCYIEYDRSLSKGLDINREESPKLGSVGPASLEWGMTHPHTPLPHMCYRAEFVRLDSNGTNVIRPTETRLTIRPLSRSLTVIETGTNRSATYDFLLTFHSNHGPISYRFRDKRRFQLKIAKFSTPRVFNVPAEGA